MNKLINLLARLVSVISSAMEASLKYFFACRFWVRIILVLIMLISASALVSFLTLLNMYRTHITVPFRAMNLADDYKPGFLHDADEQRQLRRAVRGPKEIENDPWEKDFPLDFDVKIYEPDLPASSSFRAIRKLWLSSRFIVDLDAIPMGNDMYLYDFPTLASETLDELDTRLDQIVDLKWEDIVDFHCSGEKITEGLQPDFSTIGNYLLFRKNQHAEFEIVSKFESLLRYLTLMTLSQKEPLMANIYFMQISYMVQNLSAKKILSTDESAKLFKLLSEADRRLCNYDSPQFINEYLNKIKTKMLYMQKISPFGAWLLASIYPDPLKVTHEKLELFKIPPTVENESKHRSLPYNYLNWFDDPYEKYYMNFLKESRLIYKFSSLKNILLQSLLDNSGSDQKINDLYSGSPLLFKESPNGKTYYSVGPNLRDDNMTEDDIFFEKL